MHHPFAIHVVALERKMSGGCQSSLVVGSDGKRYILKCFGNPQGSNTLFHEALGSQIARALELPVPNWRPLYVSNDFIDAHPDLSFSWSGRARTRPIAGLHFGSAYLDAEPGGEVYEVIPSSWFSRIANREDFVRMLLLDLWTDHLDRRQALFGRQSNSKTLRATFVDHGQMFGDRRSPFRSRRGRGRFLDPRIYGDWCSEETLVRSYEAILAINRLDLEGMMDVIPSEWISIFHAANVVELLLNRRSHVMQDIQRLRWALSSNEDDLPRPSIMNSHDRHLPVHCSPLPRL
jgi:hypothetical protein